MDTDSSKQGTSDSGRMETLLHRDKYSPQEVADILEIPLQAVNSAVYRGDLNALRVGNDIVHIERADLIAWLQDRD